MANFVKANQQLLLEVVKLLILILVAPATNACSERCFSALRIVKTYLQSTMGQARLNHLLILHTHKKNVITFALNNVPMISASNQSTEGTFLVLFAVRICFCEKGHAHAQL